MKETVGTQQRDEGRKSEFVSTTKNQRKCGYIFYHHTNITERKSLFITHDIQTCSMKI